MLNREEQRVHSVTLMAQDDYSPPGISYFNLHVTLTDVNDKPESVTIDGSTIPEEVEPGKHLFIIVFISMQTYQFISKISFKMSTGSITL